MTLQALVGARPDPSERAPQHLCLDKAYDNPTGEQAAREGGSLPHLRRIGEEKWEAEGHKTHPARRWVVERTLAWLSRWRGILIRWEKKADNYLAICKLACALLWYRKLDRITRSSF